MLVLGIDPGTAVTGYGLVSEDRGNGRGGSAAGLGMRLIECGVIRTKPRDPLSTRLREIHQGVSELIARHHPDHLAVEEHAAEDLEALIDGYVAGEVPDYQLSAWLMAVCWRGMTAAETAALTRAMAVDHAPEGIRGDSANNVQKSITLETGITVQAPLFIKTGEKIKVDTRTGKYMERA